VSQEDGQAVSVFGFHANVRHSDAKAKLEVYIAPQLLWNIE